MTLTELFSQEKYPLRARTQISLPNTNLMHHEERYYTNPLMHISDQESGGIVKIFTPGKLLLFSYAFLLHPNNDDTECFLFQDEFLVKISKEELDAQKDNLTGNMNSCEIVHRLATARWESF